MKLLTKSSLYFIYYSIPISIIIGIISYYLIITEVKIKNDDLLVQRLNTLKSELKNADSTKLEKLIHTGDAAIHSAKNNNIPKEILRDSTLFDIQENEYIPCRVIESTINAKLGNFDIRVWRSSIAYNELLEGIVFSLMGMLLLLIVLLFLINWFTSKSIWNPFYNTLSNLNIFKPSESEIPTFKNSNINEFKDLNNTVQQMMEKMQHDFSLQKQFTENAAHEMQTPLAVISGKVDMMLQLPDLTEKQMQLIVAVINATQKLKRLNQSLLLLAKIENQQFKDINQLNFNLFVEICLQENYEKINAKNISIEKLYTQNFVCKMSEGLAEILLQNLLNNAIRHNVKNGLIKIETGENHFTIMNSGDPIPFNLNKLFTRFQKNNLSSDSIGLGLSIVKEIAFVSKMKINYTYVNSLHCFTIYKY